MTFLPRAARVASELLPVVILALVCAIVGVSCLYVLVLIVGGGQ